LCSEKPRRQRNLMELHSVAAPILGGGWGETIQITKKAEDQKSRKKRSVQRSQSGVGGGGENGKGGGGADLQAPFKSQKSLYEVIVCCFKTREKNIREFNLNRAGAFSHVKGTTRTPYTLTRAPTRDAGSSPKRNVSIDDSRMSLKANRVKGEKKSSHVSA